jgi:hypothetical protein
VNKDRVQELLDSIGDTSLVNLYRHNAIMLQQYRMSAKRMNQILKTIKTELERRGLDGDLP